MNFKRSLILMFFSVVMLSCNPDKESIENPEIGQQVDYTFVKIEFINSEQSDQSEQLVAIPTVEYSNGTSVAQNFSYNPLKGVYETSQFSGIDTSVMNHIINSPIVAVPINTDNGITLGEAKWPLSNNTEEQQPSHRLEGSFTILANNKLFIETTLHYKKITTDFRLTLKDNKENKVHVFEGKWVGVYQTEAEFKTVFTEL